MGGWLTLHWLYVQLPTEGRTMILLRCKTAHHQTHTHIVVTIMRIVPVTVRHTTVVWIVVPSTAAQVARVPQREVD